MGFDEVKSRINLIRDYILMSDNGSDGMSIKDVLRIVKDTEKRVSQLDQYSSSGSFSKTDFFRMRNLSGVIRWFESSCNNSSDSLCYHLSGVLPDDLDQIRKKISDYDVGQLKKLKDFLEKSKGELFKSKSEMQDDLKRLKREENHVSRIVFGVQQKILMIEGEINVKKMKKDRGEDRYIVDENIRDQILGLTSKIESNNIKIKILEGEDTVSNIRGKAPQNLRKIFRLKSENVFMQQKMDRLLSNCEYISMDTAIDIDQSKLSRLKNEIIFYENIKENISRLKDQILDIDEQVYRYNSMIAMVDKLLLDKR